MFNNPIRCISCRNPFCEPHCPCGNHIRDIIALVKEGKEEEAAALLFTTNPFPEWTSQYCDHGRTCRAYCILGKRGEPFDFPALEHYLSQTFHRPLNVEPCNGKKVHIIGAGPAGLSLAYFLAKGGYLVHVYDKEDEVGGVLYARIPEFRLKKDGFKSIREDLESMGVVFSLNQEIDEEALAAMREKGEKVFFAVGAEKENTLGYDRYEGVVGGLSFLYDIVHLHNADPYLSAKKAFAWGGGNVAMDCARTLRSLGLSASIVYRRSKAEMPAALDEIEACEAEGVELQFLTNIKELKIDENGKLIGATMVKMELGEPDESGRASFHEIPGSEYEEEFDLLIPALGEKIILPIDMNDYPDIVLVGDCRYGAKTIASAIKDGREAAFAFMEHDQ